MRPALISGGFSNSSACRGSRSGSVNASTIRPFGTAATRCACMKQSWWGATSTWFSSQKAATFRPSVRPPAIIVTSNWQMLRAPSSIMSRILHDRLSDSPPEMGTSGKSLLRIFIIRASSCHLRGSSSQRGLMPRRFICFMPSRAVRRSHARLTSTIRSTPCPMTSRMKQSRSMSAARVGRPPVLTLIAVCPWSSIICSSARSSGLPHEASAPPPPR
mmetsp:Transcript_6125/g.16569  ORF Transcript_6125/g.16569 Transcript_6125/m.16569 type:complete len:217 (-) Transcript_6125:552-1202(-)